MNAGSKRPWRYRVVMGALLMTSALGGVIASCSAAAARNSDNSIVVATDQGRVKGVRHNGMREFLGMPYAAPPVGKYRWAPPQPVHAWHGVRSANRFASNCPQNASPFGNPSTNEDCLYLNVFTPNHIRPPASRHGKGHGRHGRSSGHGLPVMVWIHGGAFLDGEGSDYNPEPLVDHGVVVVTINYRLGLLGFLSTPALTAASPNQGSGDYGLMDQQAALSWVQHNIARFGGDPDNVTIFGVSAGGLSVLAQMVSPKAKGLFDKAIVESGSYSSALPGLQPDLSTAESQGKAFAAKVGCAGQGLDCLRNLPVSTILANQGSGPLSIVPNAGTSILPRTIHAALSAGDFHRVPVIEGTNATEWRLFTALSHDLTPSGPVTRSGYVQAIKNSFMLPGFAAQLVAARYPLSHYKNPDLALSAAGTGAAFACPARRQLGRLSRHVSTYAYEFADPNAPEIFVPPVSSFNYGPTHTSEIQYFLDFTSKAQLVKRPQFTPAQKKLSKAMVGYWTQFARTGNPNPSSGAATYWPKYNRSRSYISLEPPRPQRLSGFRFLREHNCGFWDLLSGVAGVLQR